MSWYVNKLNCITFPITFKFSDVSHSSLNNAISELSKRRTMVTPEGGLVVQYREAISGVNQRAMVYVVWDLLTTAIPLYGTHRSKCALVAV